MAKRHVSVDCPDCQLRVRAQVEADHTVYCLDPQGEVMGADFRASLAVCPQCSLPLVTREEAEPLDWECTTFKHPVRVWPDPERQSSSAIPAIVRVSLDEADRCHRAGAHTACAVMCGRALEGICVDKKVAKTLARGLDQLREKELIDQRLLEWGHALRQVRNLAAHATGEKISKEESTDLLHFVSAICEYIYVLTARFEAFQTRRTKPKAEGTGSDEDPREESATEKS